MESRLAMAAFVGYQSSSLKPSSRVQLLLLALVPLLVALLLHGIYGSYSSAGIPFDQRLKDKFVHDAPDVAIIGNSMVSQRLDLKGLRQQIKPLRLATVSIGGSRSLHWYCAFKNLLACNPAPPRLVVIVFRDYDFTTISVERTGTQLERLRPLMLPEDEALLKMAQASGGDLGWKQWIYDHLVAPNRLANRHNVNAADITGLLSGRDGDAVAENANLLFSPENLRSNAMDAGGEMSGSLAGSALRFQANENVNFLSRLADLAREKHIRLVFYRVKRRPDDEAGVIRHQPVGLRNYIAEFAVWAKSNGCEFIDESDDPRIIESMFQDGDHLAEKHFKDNTAWFLERIRPLLPAPQPR